MEGISSYIWSKLNQYIGCEEQIIIRRRSGDLLDEIKNFNEGFICTYFSGSRAEGFNLPGSDFDVMYLDKCILVSPTSCYAADQCDFIMETDNIKPGFARLRMTEYCNVKNCSNSITGALIKESSRIYLSSLLFCKACVDLWKHYDQGYYQHGPCATLSPLLPEEECDNLTCFKCIIWPSEAMEWVQRVRRNNWPQQDLIRKVVADGCLLVPIGNPLSDKSHIEWRISFSLAERTLIRSMNHTQFLTYGLLKVYLKKVIECNGEVKGLLCSYFLKTSLFYTIEQEQVIWDRQNIFTSFHACFKRLLEWVMEGYCPNYFIKTNNMFENKIFGENQRKLTAYLLALFNEGVHTLTRLWLFRDLTKFSPLGGQMPVLIGNGDIDNIQKELACDITLLQLDYSHCFNDHSKTNTTIKSMYTRPVMTSVDLDLLHIFQFNLNCSETQRFYCHNCNRNRMKSNKTLYNDLLACKQHILQICEQGDVCTGLLQYATLLYLNGEYIKVLPVIEHVLSHKLRKPYVIYCGRGKIRIRKQDYITNICNKGLDVQQKMKHAHAHSYALSSCLEFYPSEIKPVIYKCSDYGGVAFVPPLMYSVVLRFLSYNALGHLRGREQAFRFMEKAIHDQYFVTPFEIPICFALYEKCRRIMEN